MLMELDAVHRIPLLSALMLGSWLSGVVLASPSDESIIVTATRLPKTSASSASVSSLTATDLERLQNSFLVEALATLPGVIVSQTGAFGGQASLRLRGAASEQTLVMIDGVVVNDTTSPGGGYNYTSLDAASIERVEVLRGPQSTLWGSDAIGGVVAITTKRPRDGFLASGFLEGGSFSTARGGVALSGGSGPVDGRIAFSGIDTNGISKADRRFGNPETDPYRSWAVDGRIGLALGEAARIEAFGRYTDSTTHYDGFSFATGVADSDEVSRAKESLEGLVARFGIFGGRLESILQASNTELDRDDTSGGFLSFGSNGQRTAYRYQGRLHVTDALLAVFGAEYEKSRAETTFSSPVSIDTTGIFALVEWQPMEDFSVSGGIRNDDHSRFGQATTGSLGASWSPVEWLTLTANWSQGFKAPTIFQLTSSFPPAAAPNAALQPEEAEGWDIGAKFDFMDGRILVQATYFHIDTDNLIQFADGRYVNTARAQSEGFELEAAAALTKAMTLRASYTCTDAINAVTGTPLIRTPRNIGFVELDWQASDTIGFGAQFRYNGEEKDSVRPANPSGLVESWTRLDLTAHYALSESVEIYGRIENVTDAEYEDVFGYGTPERSGYAGVRLRFD